jgi:predicted unusual protein kinase regulating ubiquinone biosynthesis (AarF/ABC1/UbiB family)
MYKSGLLAITAVEMACFNMYARVAARPPDVHRAMARTLRTRLVALGPTYVKIGQFVSSREDVFGAAAVVELQGLQDDVPPFAYEHVDRLLRESPAFASLTDVSSEPVAAASIAQVHTARLLRGSSTRTVALKVKRPRVGATMEGDLAMLRGVLGLLTRLGVKNLDGALRVLTDFRDLLREELDFEEEARRCTRFHEAYRGLPGVRVPRAYAELSTSDVIVMDYVPSDRIAHVVKTWRARDKKLLAARIMSLFVEQAMCGHMVHGDPQPGNLGVRADGTIVMYDFGSSVTLSRKRRVLLKLLISQLVSRDHGRALRSMQGLGVSVIDEELSLRYMAMYSDYIVTLDVSKFATDEPRPPFVLSKVLLRLMRVFGTLEGVCKQLDPAFDYMAVAPMAVDAFMSDPDFLDARARGDIETASRALD